MSSIHLRCKGLFHVRGLSCAPFFTGMLYQRSSYTTSLFLPSAATIDIFSAPRFSSSLKLRHLQPNRGRRTLRGGHSVTRCTPILSDCYRRVDSTVVRASNLQKLPYLRSKYASAYKDFYACHPTAFIH